MRKRRNDIRICHKCNHMSLRSMLKKIKSLDEEAKIRANCQSYCGPCARGVFIYVNGRYVTGQTEDEVIEKAKQYLR